jgi:hypothetical protein
MDDHWLPWFGVTSSKRPVAHFAFDAAQISPATTASKPFLQDLVEHVLMERFPLHRGE